MEEDTGKWVSMLKTADDGKWLAAINSMLAAYNMNIYVIEPFFHTACRLRIRRVFHALKQIISGGAGRRSHGLIRRVHEEKRNPYPTPHFFALILQTRRWGGTKIKWNKNERKRKLFHFTSDKTPNPSTSYLVRKIVCFNSEMASVAMFSLCFYSRVPLPLYILNYKEHSDLILVYKCCLYFRTEWCMNIFCADAGRTSPRAGRPPDRPSTGEACAGGYGRGTSKNEKVHLASTTGPRRAESGR